MKVLVISSSPREDSQTLRAGYFIQQYLGTQPGFAVNLLDLREWDTGFLKHVWRTVNDVPQQFRELWEIMHEAEAYVVVTPEYNGMFSPKLSATMDLFPNSVFHHKAFGIVSASTGGIGGMRAAMHLQQYILGLSANPSPKMLLIGNVDKKITPEGISEDEFLLKQTAGFVAEFTWLAKKLSAS
ncbi:MAG TPA: NAD(P)H-dependent oxidoreductase [Candidatus Brocadiaceae bacterium]